MKKLLRHFSTLNSQLSTAKGFTLIELLIVIAIIGILATAVLVAIDPIEQINRGKDAGRLNSVDSLGHAVQAYYTSQTTYPANNANWETGAAPINSLLTAGEIKSAVTIGASTQPECTTNVSGNACYTIDSNGNAIVWTVLDAKSNKTKATCTGAGTFIAAVWSSAQGKSGVDCITGTSSTTIPGANDNLF